MKRQLQPFCTNLLAHILTFMLLALMPLAISSEEGMWTMDNLPLKMLKEKYGFEPSAAWLEHIRLASVRVGDGGSGSFVSPNGLVLTNHHVALGQLQKVSTPEKDYVKDGFLALIPKEELPCPDLELNVLVSMQNVTERVLKAVKPGMNPEKAIKARKAEIAKIESESLKKTGLRSDVVTLYFGGEYWLYRYKKYTEVRLVFAPEQQMAFFGGDPDNFTFPRHDLDMALFRAYENGQPVHPAHYLKWSAKGSTAGELAIVSGHPGSTDRLYTLAQLEFLRDVAYPERLTNRKRSLALAKEYAARGSEQARQAGDMIFYMENSLKVSSHEYEGLKNKELLQYKAKEEEQFRRLIASKPEWQKAYGDVWDALGKAVAKEKERQKELNYLKMPGMRLGNIALQIVRYVAEIRKPDGERLDGYHDSQLESLRFRLFSSAPIYPGLEEVFFVDNLKQAREELGPGHAFVKTALNGRTPEELARETLAGTQLANPALRRKLIAGGKKAIAQSPDAYIVLARRLDPLLREIRLWLENEVESIEKPAGEKIGQALFAIYGKSHAPDATFTLRLSFGTVKGYPMNGTIAPAFTTFYGLYDRACSFSFRPPFQLTQRYLDHRDKLDLSTPLNFVCACDIIGGNSGSPVINRQGELVGLVFDGNVESLIGRFVYDETANRTVSVHSAGIIEAMRKLYGAEKLVKELVGE